MFLTPFIDLGDPIERILGVSRHRKETVDDDIPPSVRQPETSHNLSTKPRIICTTNKLSTSGGDRLSGTGVGIITGPLDQSKAYFEIRIEQPETSVCVGAIGMHPSSVLAQGYASISDVPNSISVPVSKLKKALSVRDTIGVLVDISDFPPRVSATINGETESISTSSVVRGDVWPAIEILGGSVTAIFDREHLRFLTSDKLARGIEAVMVSRSII
jgi:hypothetical protein